MSETQKTPADRRAARLVTASIVAGGLALAGGSAYANSQEAAPVPAAAAAVPAAAPVPPVDADQSAREVFFAAGYDYDDAVVLGARWNVDPWEAKAEGGRELAAGRTLPIAPGSAPAAPLAPSDDGDDMAAVDAFFAAGYTYDDAVTLGETWNVDPWEAKVTGGQKLTAGETLPVAP
ncbi:hypothetical protein [Kineococcus aurantiacus]|uniref:Uncharacterized protein n=1 Tax=Kineococcus aurantiacus TaxID=37633 RepID=A0A7Y9DKV2_9ACTN|nr:hypothetical protein [Kineococcus aurantiacus]NYD22472.1 hypothetical protein [Kineococcus aurantiacus]